LRGLHPQWEAIDADHCRADVAGLLDGQQAHGCAAIRRVQLRS
jgi:hypothetical protein